MERKEIHLRDYWQVISKRRVTVYTFFLLSFGIALVATLTATPSYIAATKILVEKNEAHPLERYYYAPQDPEFLATQNQIITSKRVVLKTVRLLNLENDYDRYFPAASGKAGFVRTLSTLLNDLRQDLKARFLPAAAAAPAQLRDDTDEKAVRYSDREKELARGIMGRIKVAPVQESRVFELSFLSESPLLAKRVANALAMAYIDELLEIKMASSGYTIKWMTEKVDEERAKLEKSERSLQQFMKDHDIVTVENRVAVTPQKLAEFGTQLSRAEGKRKELEALYDQVRRSSSAGADAIDSIPAIADNATIRTLRVQLIDVERRIAELSKKYGVKHPLMIKAVTERDSLSARKNQETARVIDSVRNDFELALANEGNLRSLLASTKAETLGLNEKFSQYEVLKKEVDSNRSVYEALITRLKEQNITEKTQEVDVWVVEEAVVPEGPARPDKKKNLLLGLLLGLLGGVGLAFFIEYLDNTIKSPEDAERHLCLPLLGAVGSFLERGKSKYPELVCLEKEFSVIAENYRTLRTSLLLSTADGPPASIVITSMLPGEGKTVTALNLALTIARAGKRVLLVDADLRRPRLHEMLKLNNRQGLSTFLAGVSGLDIVQPGPLETLWVVTSGPLPPNPSELLSSEGLAEFMAEMKKQYDMVIFDSPPVVSVADTLVLARVVASVILVARAGVTTYEVAGRGMKTLVDSRAPVLGFVLNDFDARHARYNYETYYQQYCGSPSGEEQ